MSKGIDAPGAISRNTVNNRISGRAEDENPTDTAKQNYTEIGWSNDKGSIRLGHVHKQGDVTAGVILQTPDAEHQLSLDIDGPRKGWTTSTGPGNFNVECGSANEEAQDSLILNAKNGNICITATNGKIRLQGTDIELVAIGDGDARGNIKMEATENIITNSKKLMMTAKQYYRIATPGIGEVCANAVLQMYGSIFRGISDGCMFKNSKVGGQKFAVLNTALTASTIANPEPQPE
tara:strand:+ start:185 stop:889 length:705 start_codon:yes stop_codon:yes gene_type:complete